MREFPLAFHAVVKGLAVALVAASMVLQKAPALLRQRDRLLAVTRHPHGLHEALLPEVSKVT